MVCLCYAMLSNLFISLRDAGRSYHVTYQLKGEDLTAADDDFDRGEIEIRLRWAERKHDDDYALQELRKVLLVRLQSWARRLSAAALANRLRQERKQNLAVMFQAAIKITSACRMRLAFKDFRRRLRQRRAAIKIQKRVRIWIAKKVYRTLKIRSKMATRIQSRMRVCLAKAFVVRMKEQMAADLNRTVTTIQKYVRRLLAQCYVLRLKKNVNLMKQMDAAVEGEEVPAAPAGDDEEVPPPSIHEWLPFYGVDPEYGLKRNRRITQRLFNKLLRTKYSKLLTRYGIVFVDSYPPRKPGIATLLFAI